MPVNPHLMRPLRRSPRGRDRSVPRFTTEWVADVNSGFGHSQSKGSIMKAEKILMFAALALGGSQAHAEALRGDGCSDTTFRQIAAQSGPGEHILFDLAGARVHGYSIVEYAPDRFTMPQRYDVSPEVESAVVTMSALYAATGGSMTVGAEVFSDDLGLMGLGGATAYDVLADYNMQARIGDQLAQQGLPLQDPSGNYLNNLIQELGSAAMALLGLTDDATIYVTIRFVDGSKLMFKLTPGVPTAELVAHSGRDVNGNILLEGNAPEFAGTYYLPGDSIGDFLDRARQLGIEITGPQSDVVTCTWDGQQLHCTF